MRWTLDRKCGTAERKFFTCGILKSKRSHFVERHFLLFYVLLVLLLCIFIFILILHQINIPNSKDSFYFRFLCNLCNLRVRLTLVLRFFPPWLDTSDVSVRFILGKIDLANSVQVAKKGV